MNMMHPEVKVPEARTLAALKDPDPATRVALDALRDIQPAIDATAKYKVIDKSFPAQELISPYALKPR